MSWLRPGGLMWLLLSGSGLEKVHLCGSFAHTCGSCSVALFTSVALAHTCGCSGLWLAGWASLAEQLEAVGSSWEKLLPAAPILLHPILLLHLLFLLLPLLLLHLLLLLLPSHQPSNRMSHHPPHPHRHHQPHQDHSHRYNSISTVQQIWMPFHFCTFASFAKSNNPDKAAI